MTHKDMLRAIEAFQTAHGIQDPEQLEAYLAELGRESSWIRNEVASLLEAKSMAAASGESESLIERAQSELQAAGYPKLANCQITAELGSGGFGTVYRALRHSKELAPVAVKVLQVDKDSQGTLERFERERALHAQIDSPYVARVIDVGKTEAGQPYLMMELVEGALNLIKYAENEALSIEARLELFKKICSGIEHLHVNGIYHRDLKPSNILVSVANQNAEPKIIDFGLAKRDEEPELTLVGARIGTRGYMSPEQDAGEPLDMRTDIYSLGVLLHELLTGTRPELARSSEELPRLPSSRVSQVAEPTGLLAARKVQSLRQLTKLLRGDLDMIILKCIKHDRKARYQSVDALRADLQRHADLEPVLARGRGGLYAFARFARRHRIAALSSSAGVAALLIGFSVASISLANERAANRELSTAKRATEAALLESSGLNRELVLAKADVGAALSREEEVNAALVKTSEEQAQILAFERERMRSIDPTEMEAFLREEVLAQTQRGLRLLPEAEGQRRFEAFEQTLEYANFTTVALEALKRSVFRDAEAVIEAQFAEHPRVKASLLLELSDRLAAVGLFKQALSPGMAALELHSQLLDPLDPERIQALSSLGRLYRKLGEYDTARSMLTQAAELGREALGELHPSTLSYRFNLAGLFASELNSVAADRQLRALLPLFLQVFGPEHEETLKLNAALQSAATLGGNDTEAVRVYRQTYEGMLKSLGPRNITTLEALFNLTLALFGDPKSQEALIKSKQLYEGYAALKGLDDLGTVKASSLYCRALIAEGRLREATLLLRRVLAVNEEQRGPDHIETIISVANLASVLRSSGKHREALEVGTAGIARARKTLASDNLQLAGFLLDQGRTLFLGKHLEAAESLMLEAYEVFEQALGERHTATAAAAAQIFMLYNAWHSLEPSGGYDGEQQAWLQLSHGLVPEESRLPFADEEWQSSPKVEFSPVR